MFIPIFADYDLDICPWKSIGFISHYGLLVKDAHFFVKRFDLYHVQMIISIVHFDFDLLPPKSIAVILL